MSKLKLITVTDTQLPLSLLESISEQRNNGLFCDVTIIIQDRKFSAHKVVLSASSMYFRQLFSVAGQVIELNFIKADIFEEILNYIYTSKIHRVRSDKLEDLISAGQVLGVKFIANLATQLSQIKGLCGLSAEADNNGKNSKSENMPIITESFSLSTEEFKTVNNAKEGDSDSDEVLFISATEGSKTAEGEPQAKKPKNANEDMKPKLPKSENSSEVELVGQENSAPQLQRPPLKTPAVSPSDSSRSPSVKSSPQNSPLAPAPGNSATAESRSSVNPSDVLGVQKKKVLLEQSPDRPGKIRLSDVRLPFGATNGPGPDVALTKKTITLDKASEIDSLSPGCKVYANIGENTYDIVPEKEYSVEGDSQPAGEKKPPTPPQGGSTLPRGKKKAKGEQEDHYELIMDGKTFYVCVVCKRPYVCLTSLRRHFNTHSWERKYPCRYCDKVFALAEYRTKHEITHTGERRYQCLLCSETFLNYQLLSSHCKQTHNQDPSGRKKKDDPDSNLYRLLPCKTLQFKPYSFVSEETARIPVINEDGTVQHVSPGKSPYPDPSQPSTQSKILNWDDIFIDSEGRPQPGPPPRPTNQIHDQNPSTEFEFVIPDTY